MRIFLNLKASKQESETDCIRLRKFLNAEDTKLAETNFENHIQHSAEHLNSVQLSCEDCKKLGEQILELTMKLSSSENRFENEVKKKVK